MGNRLKALIFVLVLIILPSQGWGACTGGTCYASPTGSGTACTQVSPCDFYVGLMSTLGNNDIFNLAAGTYTLPQDANTTATNVTIQGVTGNPDDVIINAGGGAYYVRLDGGGTVQYITFQNSTEATRAALSAFGGGANGIIVQKCVFKDNTVSLELYDNAGTVKYNKFIGAQSDNLIYIWQPANDRAPSIYYNLFAPSNSYLAGSIYFRGNDTTATTANVYNNTGIGSKGSWITIQDTTQDTAVTAKNNIFIAPNVNDSPGLSNFSGAGGTSTLISNLSLSPVQNYSSKANGEDGFTVSNHVNASPKLIRYPRSVKIILSIDDIGAYDEAGTPSNVVISELITMLVEYGYTMTWFLSPSALSADSRAAMVSWINAGHEIGLHGYSHSNILSTNAFTVLKAGQTISIAMNQSDADPANWTGTVTVSGQSAINVTGTTSMATLKTALVDQGVTCGNFASDFDSATLAVSLTDITNQSIDSAHNLALDTDKFQIVEIKRGKDLLETEIQALGGCASCAAYSVTSFGAPYEYLNGAAMSLLKTYGFTGARGATNSDITWINKVSVNSENMLAIYSIASLGPGNSGLAWGSLRDSSSNLITDERLQGHLTWLAAIGGIAGLLTHKDSFTSAEWNTILTAFRGFTDISVGSMKDILTVIRAGTCVDAGDSQACDELTTGQNERWYLDTTSQVNYHLRPSSPAINTGVNICTGVDTPLVGCTGAGTGSYLDYTGATVPNGSAPDIGAYEFSAPGFWVLF